MTSEDQDTTPDAEAMETDNPVNDGLADLQRAACALLRGQLTVTGADSAVMEDFVAAASPERILQLISEVRELRAAFTADQES